MKKLIILISLLLVISCNKQNHKIPLERPFATKVIAATAKIFYPGYGNCYRCGLPWSIVSGHSTQYNKSSGCFPLCEKCWRDLAVPKNRMSYYQQLIEDWGGVDDATWKEIEDAVNAGW